MEHKSKNAEAEFKVKRFFFPKHLNLCLPKYIFANKVKNRKYKSYKNQNSPIF